MIRTRGTLHCEKPTEEEERPPRDRARANTHKISRATSEMGAQEEEGEAGDERQPVSSPAAFVEGGIQDACEDSCSICLESFCNSNPATVTSCNHEYHVQCILEWAQKSKECPMCWQPLSLKDTLSQELAAVEREQAWSYFEDATQIHQVSSYSDFEERIMQHLAHQLAQRDSLQNTRVSGMHIDQPLDATFLATGSRTPTPNCWISRIRSPRPHRHQTSLEPAQEGFERSPSLEDMDSLKSRFLVASAKCKETFTRATRSLKERWQRQNKEANSRARAHEVSADVVRQAFRRITPASDNHEDVLTSSNGLESTGQASAMRVFF